MTLASRAIETTQKPKDRIIVALDVADAAAARSIVSELGNSVGAFKVGLQLFMSAGPKFVSELVESGAKVFLDLKFHDIPNTVAKASVEAAKLGVWMFNLHAAGGGEMMRRACEEVNETCERDGLNVPKIIAVTVLTSSDGNVLAETGVEMSVDNQVIRLAKLTENAGLDGVVASANDVISIKAAASDANFMIVTPGIRPMGATIDDQKRVLTFGRAIANGSDYVVIGRPITRSADMQAAVAGMLSEIED